MTVFMEYLPPNPILPLPKNYHTFTKKKQKQVFQRPKKSPKALQKEKFFEKHKSKSPPHFMRVTKMRTYHIRLRACPACPDTSGRTRELHSKSLPMVHRSQ